MSGVERRLLLRWIPMKGGIFPHHLARLTSVGMKLGSVNGDVSQKVGGMRSGAVAGGGHSFCHSFCSRYNVDGAELIATAGRTHRLRGRSFEQTLLDPGAASTVAGAVGREFLSPLTLQARL